MKNSQKYQKKFKTYLQIFVYSAVFGLLVRVSMKQLEKNSVNFSFIFSMEVQIY